MLLREVVAHLNPNFEGVVWSDVGSKGNRKFAVVGNHPTSYVFNAAQGRRQEFHTTAHPEAVNKEIMAILRDVAGALKRLKETSEFGYVLAPLRPPYHNVATIHMTPEAAAGQVLGLHRDDEPHGSSLITSVSFGAEATFVMYPNGRGAPPIEVCLHHGDVVYFDRFVWHSVKDVKGKRVNITFRTWTDAPWWVPREVQVQPRVGSKRQREPESGTWAREPARPAQVSGADQRAPRFASGPEPPVSSGPPPAPQFISRAFARSERMVVRRG